MVVDEGWVDVLACVAFDSRMGLIVFGDTLMSKISNTLLPSSPAFSAAWTLLESGRKLGKLMFSGCHPPWGPNVNNALFCALPPNIKACVSFQGIIRGFATGGAFEVKARTS